MSSRATAANLTVANLTTVAKPATVAKAATVALAAALCVALPVARAAAPPLAFAIDQGEESNRFVRDGPVAAHLVVRAGLQPRLIVAFPAGDSGMGVWFAPTSQAVRWHVPTTVHVVRGRDARGRALHGIELTLSAPVPRLAIRQVLLSSVRVLRDYEAGARVPTAVLTAPRLASSAGAGAGVDAGTGTGTGVPSLAASAAAPTTLIWSRDLLDGSSGFRLSIQVLDGGHASASELIAGPDLRLLALCGAPPLSPLGGSDLLASAPGRAAQRDRRERDALSFLSYREKFLAGSWRFDTYFGRDTLLSLSLLEPVLQPDAIDSGLESVLQRLSPRGEVAHEELIGEYAMLLHEASGAGPSAAPIYDYNMLDEDFLLAPLAARWLLDDPRGAAQAARFLAAPSLAPRANGLTRTQADVPVSGVLLLRNLLRVVRRTAPFAAEPIGANLIALKAGQQAGDWRDSPTGLDGGRYPYEVNVALVPAALAAVDRLARSGLLQPYASAADRKELSHAGAQRGVWVRAAPPLFTVRLDAAQARARVRQYAVALGLDPAPAVAALRGRAVVFVALALDSTWHALPVMHSDELRLLFDQPPAAQLAQALDALMRPFPAGLMTPVGLLVANPAYAGAQAQARFTRADYHGTVVWAWQEAALAAGLTRQLQRRDLPAPLQARLRSARLQLWRAIEGARALRASELWSWSYRDESYVAEPFQPARGEVDSDAAQLWSTTFLALTPPLQLPPPARAPR